MWKEVHMPDDQYQLDQRLVAEYLESVLAGDEVSATRIVDEIRSVGTPVDALYLGLFIPVQREIGLRWSRGEVAIANEHMATEITARLMDRLRDVGVRKPALGKRVVVCAGADERHAMGARIVADFLYRDGWDVDFLGADIPGAELVRFVEKVQPDVVAISVVLREGLASVRDTIGQVKTATADIKVILGGLAVAGEEEARALGADGFGADAPAATEAARALVGLSASFTLDQILVSLGQNVQMQRKTRAWNQQQLADRAGLDRTYVSAVENGKQNLTMSALHKIASAFEIPLGLLLPEG